MYAIKALYLRVELELIRTLKEIYTNVENYWANFRKRLKLALAQVYIFGTSYPKLKKTGVRIFSLSAFQRTRYSHRFPVITIIM